MKKISPICFLLFVVVAIALVGCENDPEPTENRPIPPEALTKIVSLNFEQIDNPDDVQILTTDSTYIRINESLIESTAQTLSEGNILVVWRQIDEIPYYRRVKEITSNNGAYLCKTTRADVSEVIENLDISLDTTPYVNQNPSSGVQSRADMLLTSPILMDEDGILHPRALLCPAEYILTPTDAIYYVGDAFGDPDPGDGVVVIDMLVVAQKNASKEFRIGFKKSIDFTIPLDSENKSTRIGLKGSIGGNIGSRVALDISWFKLRKFEGVILGGYDVDLALSMGLAAEKTFGDNKYETLISLPSYTTVFVVGVVPIAITIRPEIARKVALKASGAFELTIPLRVKGDFEGGIKWDNGNWGTISSFKHEETVPDFSNTGLKAEVKIEAEAGVYVKAGVYLMSVAGPYGVIGPKLSAEGSVTMMNLANLKAKVSGDLSLVGSVGAELKLLKWSLADYHFDFTFFKLPLFSKEWEYTLQKSSADILSDQPVLVPLPYRPAV